MTQPTFAQLKALSTAAAGIQAETLWERILTVMAILASGQNPDGTEFTLGGVPVATNVLDGFNVQTATQAITTLVTVPAGRTWQGVIAASCAVQNVGASTTAGQATCLFTISGAGATPSGTVFEVDAVSGAHVAGGTVGDQGNNYGQIPAVVIAPTGNAVTIQTTITIAGTGGRVAASAIGVLIA